MKQVYDANMKQRSKVESHISITKRFNVLKSRLYEMTTGHKIGRPGKGSVEEVRTRHPSRCTDISNPGGETCQADDLGENQKAKRQKGEKSATKMKKGGKVKGTTL